MVKSDRMAGFFIIIAGIYYSWNAFVLPVRADEAFLFLKSIGSSWSTIGPTGLMEYIIQLSTYLEHSSLNLRMPSILFISISALIVFQFTYGLSGRHGAWFSLIIFFVSPPVTYAYMSATSSSLFILFSCIYIYSLYVITNSENVHIKYYIWASLSHIVLISTHFSGIIFIVLPFIYLIFQRKLIYNKAYMITAFLGIIYTAVFSLLHIFGLYELFYKYPLAITDKKIYIYLLLFIVSLPVIYIILIFIKNKKIDNKVYFLFISALFLYAGSILFNIFSTFDIRIMGAFLIPAVILSGYYYEQFGYKILLGIFTTVLVLTSAYTNISKTSELTPRFMENTRQYESIRHSIQDFASFGESIYTYDAGFSSILVYNTFPFIEACTLYDCIGNSGVFVSQNKEDNLSKYFYNVKEVNIYRGMSVDRKKTFKLYFYRVEGLKIPPENKNTGQ